MSRMNPMQIDDDLNLGDFAPKNSGTVAKKIEPAAIEELSRRTNFPSRQPSKSQSGGQASPALGKDRRYRTGRNAQINIKATASTIELLYSTADGLGIPLGEVLERALRALSREISNPKR